MFIYLYHLVNLLSNILVFVFQTTLKEMAAYNELYLGVQPIAPLQKGQEGGETGEEGKEEVKGEKG
jgi:hypothetical protein